MAAFNQKPYRSKEQYNPNFEPPVMAEREPQKKTTPLPSIGEFNQRGANALWANTMQQTPATQERARLHLGGTQMQAGPRIPFTEDRSKPVPMAQATITGEFEEPKSGGGIPALGPVGYQRTQERPVALPEYQRYNVEAAPKQNYMSLQDAVNQLYGGQNLSAMSPEDFFVRNSLINAKMAESGRDVNRADRLWKERQSALGQSADINNRGLKYAHDIMQGGQREDTLRRNLEMQEQMAPLEMANKQAEAEANRIKADALQRGLKSGALNDADIAGIQNTARERIEAQQNIELNKRLTEIDKMPEGPDKAQAIADAWAWRRGMERYTAAEAQPESGFWPFKREAVPAQYGYRKANIPALSSNF